MEATNTAWVLATLRNLAIGMLNLPGVRKVITALR